MDYGYASMSSEKTEPSWHDTSRLRRRLGGLLGALPLVCLGGFFALGGVNLGIGQITRLGPGAFPFGTGVLLVCLSCAIIFSEIAQRPPQTEAPDWVSLLAIVAALGVFALSVERIGLVPGIFATVIVASLPDRTLPLSSKAALGAVVALACWVIFVLGLNLPFKPFVGL